ncbi:unannotated protein [freshwater metagenome]|uniref:Unannotated protein n=1 Tax=freshwater metagenome TaxID=449393 RepID=A0A6J6R0Y7_9ZZZZ
MALVAGRKEDAPSILVLFDPAKSAEPPQNSGRIFARALITSPEAARVAISFPAAKNGRSASQLEGSSWFRRRSRSWAELEFFDFQSAKALFHCSCRSAPRLLTWRACAKTSLGIANFSSGFKPSSTFVAAISSSPNAEPCDLPVPRRVGAGHAITVFRRMREGFVFSFFAAIMAASSAAISTLPSSAVATSMTCQPYAR